MKRLLPLLVSMLYVSAAFAEPAPDAKGAASELIEAQLLLPMKKAEAKRSRFSRAAPVALERRVRVLDEVALTDDHGKEFVRFAIDERRFSDEEGEWMKGSVLGCAYPSEREVFVRQGTKFLPARALLGKDAKERAGVCRPASLASAAAGRPAQ